MKECWKKVFTLPENHTEEERNEFLGAFLCMCFLVLMAVVTCVRMLFYTCKEWICDSVKKIFEKFKSSKR